MCNIKSSEERLFFFQKNCRDRDLECSLTKDEYFRLLRSMRRGRCFYCQADDRKMSLDRVHAEAGYCLNNVVICCQSCNKRKGSVSVELCLSRRGKRIAINSNATKIYDRLSSITKRFGTDISIENSVRLYEAGCSLCGSKASKRKHVRLKTVRTCGDNFLYVCKTCLGTQKHSDRV